MSVPNERLRELVARWRTRAENGEAAIKHQGWGDSTAVWVLTGCADELEAALASLPAAAGPTSGARVTEASAKEKS